MIGLVLALKGVGYGRFSDSGENLGKMRVDMGLVNWRSTWNVLDSVEPYESRRHRGCRDLRDA